MAALLEHDESEVVQRSPEVVPDLVVVGDGTQQLDVDGERPLVHRERGPEVPLGGELVGEGAAVKGGDQAALIVPVRRILPQQLLPDGQRLRVVHRNRGSGQAGLQCAVLGIALGQFVVEGQRDRVFPGRGERVADLPIDLAGTIVGVGQGGAEFGIVAVACEESFVGLDGRREQVQAQRLQARHAQELVFGDAIEVGVGRAACLAEARLGPRTLLLGRPPTFHRATPGVVGLLALGRFAVAGGVGHGPCCLHFRPRCVGPARAATAASWAWRSVAARFWKWTATNADARPAATSSTATAAVRPATAGLRRHQRPNRSATLTRRACTGRSARKRRRSSAISPAV